MNNTLTQQDILALEKYALSIRIGILEQMKARGFGHVGGSLSAADLMAVLYGRVMRRRVDEPTWPERDKFVCSKGHAGPAVYAALALKGYFPYEDLKKLNQPGTYLPSHCDHLKTPGVDMTTGSLGQGCSLAVGMALGDKMRGNDAKTFLLVGDGELDEGQVWEAAMFAAAKKILNLVWIIDLNKMQLDGATRDVLDTFDIEAKFRCFGFNACTVDGHNVESIFKALSQPALDKPLAVILDTVKGKGVPRIEKARNHSMRLSEDVWEEYLVELKDEYARRFA